jgi:phytoene dehydrogenase-like protein
MTERIEGQVERFAPGFRDRILARATHSPAEMEAHDANYIGGDINGGIEDIRQLIFRPWPSLDPYRLGDSGLYLCSSSTPPGGGVHGMCGMLAARSALRHELR